jgi:hypothetical protein
MPYAPEGATGVKKNIYRTPRELQLELPYVSMSSNIVYMY